MADTICASQGPHNPRLRPDLLDKQQVVASKYTGTTEALREVGSEGFNKMVANLVVRGWGGATKGRALSYTADRFMP